MRKGPAHNYDPAFRAIADAALRRYNRQRNSLPKCGARAKHTGEQCRQPALENGKCRFHGGRTPKGAQYHKPRWPDRKSPNAVEKLERKLRDLQRAEKRRAERVAAMTPDELAAYHRWQRNHAPGPGAARARRRKEIADARDVRKLADRPPSAEEERLQDEIDRLEALLLEPSAEAVELDIFG